MGASGVSGTHVDMKEKTFFTIFELDNALIPRILNGVSMHGKTAAHVCKNGWETCISGNRPEVTSWPKSADVCFALFHKSELLCFIPPACRDLSR